MTDAVDYETWARRFAEVGSALSEKRNLQDLLSTILTEIRRLTRSDAGSVYRLVDGEERDPVLRFERAQNDSVELPERDFTLPMDRTSLAGYVACEGEVLNLADVYELPDGVPYGFDRSVDETLNYRTTSMLVVPLQNREGEVRGVLQLMNRKRDFDAPIRETEVEAYPEPVTEMVEALSSQAAVAIERAELDESIEAMIHSMIRSLVNALDERDEITTGHSRRLAEYALALARGINRSDASPWSEVTLSDEQLHLLYHAALLHDIGKIAVPEDVLNKKNRLSDQTMETIRFRLAYLEASGQAEDTGSLYERLEAINESGYLEEDDAAFLEDLHARTYRNPDGRTCPWLTDPEYRNLSIERGNLTDEERTTIEDHARASYEILTEIEWTRELERVPRIASLHHEKLDGSGYPWGLEGDEIPLLARVLCVVDIYEALTASDRPYKAAKSDETARAILEEEAELGHVDPDLVDLFFEDELYDRPIAATGEIRRF